MDSLMRDGCRLIPMPVPAWETAPSKELGWGLGLVKGLLKDLRRLVARSRVLGTVLWDRMGKLWGASCNLLCYFPSPSVPFLLFTSSIIYVCTQQTSE